MVKQEEEKNSGVFSALKTAGQAVIGLITGSNKSKEDSNEVDLADPSEAVKPEPVMEEREELTEAQFVSLLETCSEEEIVVR